MESKSSDTTGMSPKARNQVMVSLSDKALEEFEAVAEWKGQPLASLLREILEDHHRSPSFASLLRRVREEPSDQ